MLMMKRLLQRGRKQDGFTLIELIVVVAILGILAAVVTPRVLDAVDNAKQNSALAFGKEIQLAMERYYLDEAEYPDAWTKYDHLVADLEKYTTIDKTKLDTTGGLQYTYSEDGEKAVDYELKLVLVEADKTIQITPESVTIVD